MIDNDMVQFMDLAELYEKGLPPMAGGALDQAKAFTDGCRQLWGDTNQLKAEAGIF